jgi:hypothetical protein
MRPWNVAATWDAMVRRLEELTEIPADERTEAEERARYAIARWLEGRADSVRS